MKAEQLIKALNKQFPQLDPQLTSDFYGREQEVEGVWLRKAWTYDLTESVLAHGWENPLSEFIESKGWHIEPYDSETFMAYQG